MKAKQITLDLHLSDRGNTWLDDKDEDVVCAAALSTFFNIPKHITKIYATLSEIVPVTDPYGNYYIELRLCNMDPHITKEPKHISIVPNQPLSPDIGYNYFILLRALPELRRIMKELTAPDYESVFAWIEYDEKPQ